MYADNYDEEGPVVVKFGTKDVRARKQFPCDECLDPVLPGQVYVRQAAKVDGEILVLRSHTGNGACIQ